MASENFITHEVGPLPIWAWGLVIGGGVIAGVIIIPKLTSSTSGIPASGSSTTSAGTVAADTSGTNGAYTSGNPFQEVPTGSGNVPVVPSGYTPIYDSNGNLIGWQAPTTPPVASSPGNSIFLGPTGVKHYIVQQGETLSSIAAKFGLASWNDIYAIPANQAVLGKLTAVQARTFMPRAGTVITLPPNATSPVQLPTQNPPTNTGTTATPLTASQSDTSSVVQAQPTPTVKAIGQPIFQ